jgi:hypothetical protein
MKSFFLAVYQRIQRLQKEHGKWLFVLKVAVSVFFIAYIVSRIDIELLIATFSKIDVGLFFCAFVVTFVATIFYNLRYSSILLSFDRCIPFWRLYVINRFSNLINFFLPGGIGQEVGRLACIEGRKKVVLSSLVDRFVGLFSLFLILIFSLFFIHVNFLYVLAICASAVASLVCFIYLQKRFCLKLIVSLVWSLVYSVLLVIMSFFQLKAVGIDVDFLYLLFLIPLLNLVLILPISVQGYGLREFFWFVVLGISSEKILAFTIIGYFINLILSLPGLWIIPVRKKCLIPSDTDSN